MAATLTKPESRAPRIGIRSASRVKKWKAGGRKLIGEPTERLFGGRGRAVT